MKIIEVTGIAGVGKSYIINQLSKDKSVLLDTTIEKEELSDLKLTYLFFKLKDSFKMLKLICKIALLLRISLFHKLNFIRNSIKKFGKNQYLMKIQNNKYVVVDEGITHFYQNIISPEQDKNEEIVELVDRLISYANFSNEVIVVDAPSEVIFQRLSGRGHKRLNSDTEIKKFIQKSKINLELMKKKFSNSIDIENVGEIDIKPILGSYEKGKKCMNYQKN